MHFFFFNFKSSFTERTTILAQIWEYTGLWSKPMKQTQQRDPRQGLCPTSRTNQKKKKKSSFVEPVTTLAQICLQLYCQ